MNTNNNWRTLTTTAATITSPVRDGMLVEINRHHLPALSQKSMIFHRKERKDFSQRTQSINDVIAGNDPQSPVRRFTLGDSCFRRNDGVILCALCVFFASFAVKKAFKMPSFYIAYLTARCIGRRLAFYQYFVPTGQNPMSHIAYRTSHITNLISQISKSQI